MSIDAKYKFSIEEFVFLLKVLVHQTNEWTTPKSDTSIIYIKTKKSGTNLSWVTDDRQWLDTKHIYIYIYIIYMPIHFEHSKTRHDNAYTDINIGTHPSKQLQHTIYFWKWQVHHVFGDQQIFANGSLPSSKRIYIESICHKSCSTDSLSSPWRYLRCRAIRSNDFCADIIVTCTVDIDNDSRKTQRWRNRRTIQLCIIAQDKVSESHQIPQCGWNSAIQLIVRHAQVFELFQISESRRNSAGQLIIIQTQTF